VALKEVELLSDAWHGEKRITINFPSSRDVVVVGEKNIPALTDYQIREESNNPIGSPGLSDLALKKDRPAIFINDLTRPTLTAKRIAYILEELKFAGINRGLNGIQITAWGVDFPHLRMSSWHPELIEIVSRFETHPLTSWYQIRLEKINDCNENRE